MLAWQTLFFHFLWSLETTCSVTKFDSICFGFESLASKDELGRGRKTKTTTCTLQTVIVSFHFWLSKGGGRGACNRTLNWPVWSSSTFLVNWYPFLFSKPHSLRDPHTEYTTSAWLNEQQIKLEEWFYPSVFLTQCNPFRAYIPEFDQIILLFLWNSGWYALNMLFLILNCSTWVKMFDMFEPWSVCTTLGSPKVGNKNESADIYPPLTQLFHQLDQFPGWKTCLQLEIAHCHAKILSNCHANFERQKANYLFQVYVHQFHRTQKHT